MVFLAEESPYIRSYTVQIYGSGQPYTQTYTRTHTPHILTHAHINTHTHIQLTARTYTHQIHTHSHCRNPPPKPLPIKACTHCQHQLALLNPGVTLPFSTAFHAVLHKYLCYQRYRYEKVHISHTHTHTHTYTHTLVLNTPPSFPCSKPAAWSQRALLRYWCND